MNQFETKHYKFFRTSKDAFGSFIEMRKINLCENDPHNSRDTYLIVAVVIFIVLSVLVM